MEDSIKELAKYRYETSHIRHIGYGTDTTVAARIEQIDY